MHKQGALREFGHYAAMNILGTSMRFTSSVTIHFILSAVFVLFILSVRSFLFIRYHTPAG